MKELTCIILGGGYAGLNAIQALHNSVKGMQLRLILIDKQPHHLRKVLMFKPAADQSKITIPWSELLPESVTFIQGSVTSIQDEKKRLQYEDRDGDVHMISYDLLVVALGSSIRKPTALQGGSALADINDASLIQLQWKNNLHSAVKERNMEKRKQIMSLAVVGAGISGIETSAELASAMQKEASSLGLHPEDVRIYLINAQNRLFPEGPAKVGTKLERSLNELGVTVLHNSQAEQEKDGILYMKGGKVLHVGLCIWTLGLLPNPALRNLGIPLTNEGKVIVDASYRVQGLKGVYSIGDCAHIVDPKSAKADRMTCKEAIPQANRLSKIIAADLDHRSAPTHQSYLDLFCIGLGPERGLVWCRQWGLDFVLTGKLGWKIRKYTWDSASLIK